MHHFVFKPSLERKSLIKGEMLRCSGDSSRALVAIRGQCMKFNDNFEVNFNPGHSM